MMKPIKNGIQNHTHNRGIIKKGEVRNPHGRPKKAQSITEMMRERADPKKVADVIIKGVYAGDARFVSLLMDRTEGKVPDTIVQINTLFKEGDVLADRTLLWLTKYHPKLVREWSKAVGLER